MFRKKKAVKPATPEITLYRYIRNRKWTKARKLLQTPSAVMACKYRDDHGINPLSKAVYNNAPIEIIQKLIELYPQAMLETDDRGNTPLHWACSIGIELETVHLLLDHELSSEAASIPDSQNYCPLHNMVELTCIIALERYQSLSSFAMSFTEISLSSYFDDSLGTLKKLCELAPEVVLQPSYDTSVSPLEIPHTMSLLLSCEDLEEIYNERVEHVYSLLKSTATEVYKKKSKECEAKKIITTKEEDKERLNADVKRIVLSCETTVEISATSHTT